MKILLLDIETAPNLAHVWGLWQQNVSLAQLRESSYMLCFGAKWLGDKEVEFYDVRNKDEMLHAAWHFFNEADAIVTYNGDTFDLPIMRQEMLLAGFAPPASPRSIDLCRAVKRAFRFPSNKLQYVANALGLGGKVEHTGHQLWVDCLAGDPAAWELMKKYNIGDVDLLDPLYRKLKPWLPNHPNVLLYDGQPNDLNCTRCGSNAIQLRGFAHLITGKYRRYVCKDCGSWSRSTTRSSDVDLVGV